MRSLFLAIGVLVALCLIQLARGDAVLAVSPWMMDRLRFRAPDKGMPWNVAHNDPYADSLDDGERVVEADEEQPEADFSFKGDIKDIFGTDFQQDPMQHLMPRSSMLRPKKGTDAFRLKRGEEEDQQQQNNAYVLLRKKVENKSFRLKKDVGNGAFRLKKKNSQPSYRLKRAR